MKKGFTLLEMISIIIILSVVAILSFSSMTRTIQNVDAEELKTFKDQINNACSVYVETFINEHFIGGSNTEYIMLTTLMDEKFLNKNMTNPSDCRTSDIVIKAYKESDKTITYTVRCRELNQETGNYEYKELKKAS